MAEVAKKKVGAKLGGTRDTIPRTEMLKIADLMIASKNPELAAVASLYKLALKSVEESVIKCRNYGYSIRANRELLKK